MIIVKNCIHEALYLCMTYTFSVPQSHTTHIECSLTQHSIVQGVYPSKSYMKLSLQVSKSSERVVVSLNFVESKTPPNINACSFSV